MTTGLLARASLRFYGQHPWQLILAITGIALGVAVFAGIQLANDSARRAFEASTAALSGQETHRLLPAAGFLPDELYRELKSDRRFIRSAPVIEQPATLTGPNGRRIPVTLRGIDLIEESALRGAVALGSAGSSALRLIAEPGTVVLEAGLAARAGIGVGDQLTLQSGNSSSRVRVIDISEALQDDGSSVTTDIATAQAIAGLRGQLTRIDLALDDAAASALTERLSAAAVLVPAASAYATLDELTRAFNTNLTALGLLALLVGMFLIYSTISFTIVQRWRSIALLRSIGLSRRELLGQLLGEAGAIGVLGTTLGLLLGMALATGLLELVLRTLDDLYLRRTLASEQASRWIPVYCGALGIGATLAAALIPALMALRRPVDQATRSTLEQHAHALARGFALAAVPTLALAALTLLLAPRSLLAAFIALFFTLTAGAMLVPVATRALMRVLELPAGALFGLPGRMAARGVTASLSRTGVATAALTVAVATVMSIGLMIGSFRSSLIDWIETTTTADLYVDMSELTPAATSTLPEDIAQVPGVVGISRMRTTRLATPAGEVAVRAAAPGPEGYGIDIAEPASATAEELLADDDVLLISEPFAYRRQLAPGDHVQLPTTTGLREFVITGIYRDYNTAGTELLLPLAGYQQAFGDLSLTSIGVHIESSATEADVIAGIRALARTGAPLRIRSTGAIRDLSLIIFDRTFQITEVLRLLAGIVAFLGILSAVMALQLEREREFAVLRGLGMTVRQLFGLNLAQTGLLGLTAGLAALPLGTALAWLLTTVINRRSFGWSIDFEVRPDALLAGLAMAVMAAVLAGLYPAFVGARADTGLAWRDD